MQEIAGIKYLTEKDASRRYGFSQRWFQEHRYQGNGPVCLQVCKKGKILYPLEQTDEWFRVNLKEVE